MGEGRSQECRIESTPAPEGRGKGEGGSDEGRSLLGAGVLATRARGEKALHNFGCTQAAGAIRGPSGSHLTGDAGIAI